MKKKTNKKPIPEVIAQIKQSLKELKEGKAIKVEDSELFKSL